MGQRADVLEPSAETHAVLLDDVADILRTVRANLDMDIAFVGEFVGGTRVLRHVDAAREPSPIRAGDAAPLSETYCARVVDGRLPELIRDTGEFAAARSLPATRELPVGAHLSVPIRLSDGRIYGTFCCFAFEPDAALGQRDLNMLRTFADIAARRIDKDLKLGSVRSEKAARVRAVLEAGGPTVVYQPVYLIDGLRVAGAEALARFPMEPRRPPDEWFREAVEVGLQTELEFAAIRNALAGYREVWRGHRVQLGLNASPATIVHPRFPDLFEGYPTDRIVIELTEHEEVRDYAPLVAELACLRASNMRIAIDDVGAGYASMRHILAIRPDIMKLDLGIVRAIDSDAMKLALATSLVNFAGQFNCKVVAEGVETEGELDVLRCLDVQAAQGYLLGRPEPVAALLRRLSRG
ncbi:sensor domain-containing phosphodiesterase [Aureimonas leprariae]|uniref:EAL domain-containing protein n=1 Tax=Plantimonas leprariae TaxID=2615207 RepID=A0A7V7PLN3_9HYPH|nr:EAL domain-containing protein [Aureimonas leprariae]KAB0677228.1 EAL domain-containing protein [Aureimonas leprariae]